MDTILQLADLGEITDSLLDQAARKLGSLAGYTARIEGEAITVWLSDGPKPVLRITREAQRLFLRVEALGEKYYSTTRFDRVVSRLKQIGFEVAPVTSQLKSQS